jgi:hypothetical protein
VSNFPEHNIRQQPVIGTKGRLEHVAVDGFINKIDSVLGKGETREEVYTQRFEEIITSACMRLSSRDSATKTTIFRSENVRANRKRRLIPMYLPSLSAAVYVRRSSR